MQEHMGTSVFFAYLQAFNKIKMYTMHDWLISIEILKILPWRFLMMKTYPANKSCTENHL